MILTNTPVRDEIAAKKTKQPTENASAALKSRRSLFGRGVKEHKPGQAKKTVESSSDSDSDGSLQLDDESDISETDDIEIMEGDFVIVKVAGKSRIVNYIARVDVVGGKYLEGVFLQKLQSLVGSKEAVFVPDMEDEATFDKADIVHKLPQPKTAGRSTRCQGQLVFPCDLSKWQLK